MTELVVENIQKWLGGSHILKGCSFTAEKGSLTALLGSSGSGKTTLLRAVAGLNQPEIGRVAVGEDIVFDSEQKIAQPPEARNIGFVFQSYALWPHRTVRENVGYGLKLRNIDSAEIKKQVDDIIGRIGLSHLADRYPDQLSGGQQQRVAICRALVYKPRVLFMDEPMSNLDAKLREEARYWIRNLIRELEICAILVTHDQSDALAAADSILLLEHGQIVQEGSPSEIYSEPASFYAADFMGANNVIYGTVSRNGDVIAGNGWSFNGRVMGSNGLLSNGKARAVIRVEQLSVTKESTENAIELDLVDNIYLGDHWEYRLERGDLKLKAHGASAMPIGKVWVKAPQESVWLYPAK